MSNPITDQNDTITVINKKSSPTECDDIGSKRKRRQEYQKLHYIQNRQHYLDYQKRYKLENRDKVVANHRKWKERNAEHVQTKHAEWRASHREQCRISSRNSRFKKLYKLTFSKFQQMVSDQNNCCALCSNPFKNEKDINVDHNHELGEVRNLLCLKCNFGIGIFNEDTALLGKAIQYLNKWSFSKSDESTTGLSLSDSP